ncbi:MAG TPA: hypothetical protein VE422_08180 [Terriglobia bacterium]|nr:hypothetical protein [Terriglobia bacterium]
MSTSDALTHRAGARTAGEWLLGWLDDASDRLSPIVVKEVRQMVRGREFNYSFGLSLVVGLVVAFLGGADALNGTRGAGTWIFGWLMSCLSLIGIAVVPLGAFNALRNERADQTLNLVTLTALSARRIVVGKLLAQGVKLATLFAALSPFVAMSFLLGGIDFISILVSLVTLFIWSLWACALCFFLSSLSSSRAVSGFIFAGALFMFLIVFLMGRSAYFALRYGLLYGGTGVTTYGSSTGSDFWWMVAISTAFCLMTLANLVLLAENRLSLPTEDRTTALRVGFFAQFLLIVAVAATHAGSLGATTEKSPILGVVGGLHLALVATFAVTEDLALSRRVVGQNKSSSRWRRLLVMFNPGGGRGAAYVLAQMVLLLAVSRAFAPTPERFRWLLAICSYICFFTGVPTCIVRLLAPARARAAYLRVGVFLFFPLMMIFSELFSYLRTPSRFFDPAGYSVYEVLDPFRTLANWPMVEKNEWYFLPLGLGLIGLASYLTLIQMGRRMYDHVKAAH